MLSPKPVNVECPRCHSTESDCLVEISQHAAVDYMRCQDCWHVWTLPRNVEPPCDYDEASEKTA